MLLEIAEIDVRAGREEAFMQAMREQGMPELAACSGVVSARFGRGIENPARFTFNVVWTSLDAHAAARELPAFARFRSAMGDMTEAGRMTHFEMDEALVGASA